jgi:hypothetical protein
MDMFILVVLCILTVAVIQRQNASIGRMMRVRVEKDRRENR